MGICGPSYLKSLGSTLEYAYHYLCQQCHEDMHMVLYQSLIQNMHLPHGIIDRDNDMHTPS